MGYRTYGYLSTDGATVYKVFHTNDDGSVSWDHAADERESCKACTSAGHVADVVGAKRMSERARGALDAIRVSRSASKDTPQNTPHVSTKQYGTAKTEANEDAKRAMVEAMKESMAEEDSEESEAFRTRLAESLDKSSVNDTDE